jgi:hypothetical protein
MARIDSYTSISPTTDDYLLGTDDPSGGGVTRNFTVQSIIDLTSESLGDTNDYLDSITVEAGYAADASDTATITFSVGSQADLTLNLGGAAFKAANHYATSTALTDHINDTTQPHSLDSIVGSGTITAAKLSGNPGNGTTGQVLLSDGSGGFSWGNDQDDNDNYYLTSVTRPDSSSNDVLFTITGGSNVTAEVFNEGAFLSKSEIRADIKNNVNFVANDFSFLGSLATKDKVSAADINENAIINSKIKDNTIEESKLKITNNPVDGYVLTADGTDGNMEWVQNSSSNYYLDGITRGGTNNRTLTFSVNGGTDRTYTFGDGAFANYGTGANDVARGNHSHVITDISGRGALSELDTVGTSEIANDAVTAAKLQPTTVGTDGQVLSIDGSGDLQWINSSAQSIPTLRLLPTSIGTASQVLRVNSGATAVEYVDLSVGKTEINASGAATAGKILAIDQNNDLVWADEGEVTLSANSISTGMIQDDAVTPAEISVFEDNITSTTAGHMLVSDGTVFDNVAMSGDIYSVSSAGAVSLNLDNLPIINDATKGTNEIAIVDKNGLYIGTSNSGVMTITTLANAFAAENQGSGLETFGYNTDYTGIRIKDNAISYAKLADEFTTRDANVTLASGSASKDIDFDSKAVYEVTLPTDSTATTLNFDGADIGMTKVVLIKTQSSAYTGTLTFSQTSGTGTFVRLSSDDIVKDASTTNYVQITCIDKSSNDCTYIYTVGTAQ